MFSGRTTKVLFVCVENAGRSQIAEAFAKKFGQDKFEASSAGNKPAEKANPVVVEVMKEKGIDISGNKPKQLTFQMANDSDLIVTMGCNDQMLSRTLLQANHPIGNSKTQKENPSKRFGKSGNEIERRVIELVGQN